MATLFDSASLALIPSGVKESKVYSIKPTDGSGDFTFSRGTDTATRVNASGLIEKERANLLTYSNDFSQWSPKNGTFAQGVADPFGGNNAWSLTATSTDPFVYQNPSITGVVTFSVWAKGVGSSIGKDFKLVANGASPTTQTRTLTSEWVRYEGFFNAASANIIGLEIPDPAVTGDVVHLYGAQLNYGTIATDYIETTTAAVYEGITDNLPRLDYSGGASCPSLLLEPSRTNLITQSEYFGSSEWNKSNATITDNNSTSPEGIANADLITASGSGVITHSVKRSVTTTSGSVYAFSLFAKKGTTDWVSLRHDNGGTFNYFNLATGTKGATCDASATIENYGNGWYRLTVFHTATGSNGGEIYVATANGTISFEAAGQTLYIYGAQYELGSYPTSYIPTYGTSASRAGDTPTLGNLEVNGIFGATAGTFMLEYASNEPNYIFDLEKTTGQKLRFFYDASSELLQIRDTTKSAWYFTNLDLPLGENSKVLLRWSGTTLTAFVNGTKAASDYTLNAAISIADFSGIKTDKTKQMLCFPTALTDAECIALTTI